MTTSKKMKTYRTKPNAHLKSKRWNYSVMFGWENVSEGFWVRYSDAAIAINRAKNSSQKQFTKDDMIRFGRYLTNGKKSTNELNTIFQAWFNGP